MAPVNDGIWEVIQNEGGNSGIPVTAEEDPKSATLGRLAKGAFVQQLAPPVGSRHSTGRRLQFSKLSGGGPDKGWITTSHYTKDFVARNYDFEAKDLQPHVNEAPPPDVPSGSSRPFDIVVYGATGFTGTLAVEHLDAVLSSSGKRCSWALAGRTLAKLRALSARCKTKPPVIEAREDEELSKLAACTRVLLAAAGPYQRCGEAVVKACVEQGTHYVDVTGEIVWVHDIIKKYHAAARKRGVMVVQCAGQICTIDEINLYLLTQKLGALKHFREYFYQYGDTTGGTLDTNIATYQGMTNDGLKVLRNPFCLGGKRRGGMRAEDADCTVAEQDPLFPSLWLQTAYSTPTGSRILRRSSELFDEDDASGLRYGDELVVTIREGVASQRAAQQQIEMTKAPADVDSAKVIAASMVSGVMAGQAPKPGQGPPVATREMYYSEAFAVAESERGAFAHVRYTGPEAYEATAICCVSAAMTLAEEIDRLKPTTRGGVLTPAFAFHGSTFVERLQAHAFADRGGRKLSFKVADGKPSEDELKEAMKSKMKNASVGQADIFQGKYKKFE
mmetsp:Transcript_42639/g.91455  ORF Transcript_42639/g.91455 Transcript_42639/m.91455 type:complete len:560 (+) Transcript_42639:69-1748(+)|eukprot:CAMPEP_0206423438 /NCGR_PEP_ID=MMETSP0324_2-20121206/2680_1 /ASSEMBLY_ACC=CAM_ASM_000836 /TAXON_ID=2866 /ORGANISM="Crypthecodinium cohnii, Strain Seligo" /LENGTH=559 /DNA_ID=CAMNT_0053887997 /DNA_START=59 /DNA_END=1738 /DNA_ORIENTATION=-